MTVHQLEAEVRKVNEVTLVTIAGVITEDNNLTEIADKISTEIAIINTAQVNRINSPGVRDWVYWITQLENRGITSFFVECSLSIMSQVNLVKNFIGKGTVLSFYAPFFCTACDASRLVLVNVEDILQHNPIQIPIRRCNECDHLMEFDERESFFFSFLSWAKVGPVKPALAKALSEATRSIVGDHSSKKPTMELITADHTPVPSFGAEATTEDIPLLAEDLEAHERTARTRPGMPLPDTATDDRPDLETESGGTASDEEKSDPRTGPGEEAPVGQQSVARAKASISPVAWLIVAALAITIGILIYLASKN